MMSHSEPLKFIKGHLYITLEGEDWVIDTGSPASFGDIATLVIAGESYSVSKDMAGLDASTLSSHVHHKTVGLIGTDILNNFNILFDVSENLISFSKESIIMKGEVLETSHVMGIPVVNVLVDGAIKKMFFDTGAQVSYVQRDVLDNYPMTGKIEDFYPGIGAFQTTTHDVEISFGSLQTRMSCGSLPEMLGMTLLLAGTDGIIGNEIMMNRSFGYFPLENKIIISKPLQK